jgi:hypothetical protein
VHGPARDVSHRAGAEPSELGVPDREVDLAFEHQEDLVPGIPNRTVGLRGCRRETPMTGWSDPKEGVAPSRRLQGTSPAFDFAAFLSLLD